MAKGISKTILVGNLGSDPEVRYSGSGSAVCSFNVATTESWKNKDTGQPESRTEWHKVTAFNRLAEICGEYLKKGSQVYVEGQNRTSSYEKDGEKRYSTAVVISEMQMLGSKGEGGSAPQQNKSQQQGNVNNGSGNLPPNGAMDFDDDIPF